MKSSTLLQASEFLLTIEIAENSFYEFVKQSWPIVMGNIPFHDSWHIEAICEHLEAVNRREIKNLLINMPPRCLKSTLTSVMWPAYTFIKYPHERFLCSSYAASLSRRDSRHCINLIKSHWYQQRWGHVFKIEKETEMRFENDKKGQRLATSTCGAATGEGGSILISDDANNVKHSESLARIHEVLEWWDAVWSTRLNNVEHDAKINIQQRIGTKDVSAHILNNDEYGEWVKLILPMEFDKSRRTKTIILPSTNGKVWQDPRVKQGEYLCPSHIGIEGLNRLKRALVTPTRIAGQLQQAPYDQEGDLIKRSYFKIWEQEVSPGIILTIQSWDTAMGTKKTNCYSACSTFGLFYDKQKLLNIILLSAWKGQVEYPHLRAMAKRLYYDYRDDGEEEVKVDGNHRPDYVLVESKMSGISLLHDFKHAGIPATGFNPDKYGDKTARVQVITQLLESGRVWVPAKPPDYKILRRFADEFVSSCVSFPSERDYTDSMVQVLLKLKETNWLRNSEDDDPGDTSVYNKRRIY